MLKFGQKEVATKDFYEQRQITDIFTIDVDYQVDVVLISLFIKTPKNIFSCGVSQYDKNSAYTVPFNISEEKMWVTQYEKDLE